MANPVLPVMSPLLRETAVLKIEELTNMRDAFHDCFQLEEQSQPNTGNVLERVKTLKEKITKFDPTMEIDNDMAITRLIDQAENDCSISEAKLRRVEINILDNLKKHAERFNISKLHVGILEEALQSDNLDSAVGSPTKKLSLDDEFELVEGGLEDKFDAFEKDVFSSPDVDTNAIEEYLMTLFDNEQADDQLRNIRRKLKKYGEEIMDDGLRLEEETLRWSLKDLIKNGLLNDDKKKTLEGYLQSPLALRELKNTLSTKSIRHWTWRNARRNGKQGLQVTARKDSDGKYCIVVEEDLVDMIFLHCIAAGWRMRLRQVLKDAITTKKVWPGNNLLTLDELDMRDYYLAGAPPKPEPYTAIIPRPLSPPSSALPSLPPPPPPVVHVVPEKKRRGHQYSCLPPGSPTILSGTLNINDERYQDYLLDFFMPKLLKVRGDDIEAKDINTLQSLVMKTLATEARLCEAFNGTAHGLIADFKSLSSTLPHKTILTVLKFLGVPQQWLGFFSRFLSAPLNIGPVLRGASDRITARTCGVPLNHGLTMLFQEAILFFLDLNVHQNTNGYLYRVGDLAYFVGIKEHQSTVSANVRKFSRIMNVLVEIVPRLTSIGFINFTLKEKPEDKPFSCEVDAAKVKAYALQVKKQLEACSTIVSWIQTWNSLVGSYASHLFGPLANVFGKAHLEAVTKAHNTMFDIIFGQSNLTDHIKALVLNHLQGTTSHPPSAFEAIIFLPLAYGGLGVKNPYNTFSLAHTIYANPSTPIVQYLETEKKYYDRAKTYFARLTTAKKEARIAAIFEGDQERIASALAGFNNPSAFPAIEHITSSRERAFLPHLPPNPYPEPRSLVRTPDLIHVYTVLLAEPVEEPIASVKLVREVRRLQGRRDMKAWRLLRPEDAYTLQVYQEECFEKYGGIEVWKGEYVPESLLKLVRGEEVDDDEGDDDDEWSSVGSYTEI